MSTKNPRGQKAMTIPSSDEWSFAEFDVARRAYLDRDMAFDEMAKRIADQTLNNELVVTNENAEELLEAMRQATIEDEKKAFEGKLAAEKAKAKETLSANAIKTRRATEERDEARAQLDAREQEDAQNIQRIAGDVTTMVRRVETCLTLAIAVLAVVRCFQLFHGRLVGI
jgi:hypothetical protein